MREWIRWFEIRRTPKGEHIHVFGYPLHKAQGLESRTSNHYKLNRTAASRSCSSRAWKSLSRSAARRDTRPILAQFRMIIIAIRESRHLGWQVLARAVQLAAGRPGTRQGAVILRLRTWGFHGGQCGREDSNLQPVSRPDPKFDGGPSGQSGVVRLVPVCAVQSSNGTSNRPTWRAFELSCAAGSVRSFVRSVGRQPHPPATIKTTTAAAELKHLAV